MRNRINIDPIVIDIIQEMKEKHKIATNKELVEKCIVFCSINNVIFNESKIKSFNDLYFKMIGLEKAIENLPLNILKAINTEI